MEEEQEKKQEVREHDFDGIQEYDNSLPNWWIGTFVVTVLFGLWYWTSFHTFAADPNHQKADFDREYAQIQALQAAKGLNGPGDGAVLAAYRDPAQVQAGARIFATNCVACHGPDGGGVIGPNLTDDYWLHGNRPSQIAATITNGVPDKGMVTWKGVLKPEEIVQAAAFVLSLHGTKPKAPKAPQGEKVEWTIQ